MVDLVQMAVLVRSSSFLRIRSTSEVAREVAGGRNRLLARLSFDSNFQMEVQGCACGEAAASPRRQNGKQDFEEECLDGDALLCLVQHSLNQLWTQRVQRKSILQKNWSDSSQWVSIPHGQGTTRRWRWSGLQSD